MRIGMLFVLLLVACSSTQPASPVPYLRQQADAAQKDAVRAAYQKEWALAARSWRLALAAYQAIDAWPEQGGARLGLAVAQAALGQGNAAQEQLRPMLEGGFSSDQQVRAAYQLALLEKTAASLTRAQQLCAGVCSVAVQIDNLAAREALRAGDKGKGVALAQRALGAAVLLPAEAAHARRLLAEAAMQAGDLVTANQHLQEAIRLDRQLAEPDWLVDDYRLLEQIGRRLPDESLIKEALRHRASICAGWKGAACVAADGALR